MKIFKSFAVWLAPLSLILSNSGRAEANVEREVENLATFARVYGYVRFFHPSDQVAEVDWDRLGIYGARQVRDVANERELRESLNRIFLPIAPTMVLSEEPVSIGETKGKGGKGVTFWQHVGVGLEVRPGPYRSSRVIPKSKGERKALFRGGESGLESFQAALGDGLYMTLPRTGSLDGKDRTMPRGGEAWDALQRELALIDLDQLTPDDWSFRVAGVVTVWNVFQHFHPYLDQEGEDWLSVLPASLKRTLGDRTALDYHATLSELVAQTGDGHGYVFGRPKELDSLPVRVEVIEGEVVVNGVGADVGVEKGDVVVSVDGMPALEVLSGLEHYVSGSPHLKRFRALNQFWEGPKGSVARVELERGGEVLELHVPRDWGRVSFFFNSIAEFDFPAIEEVRPSIYYVNIMALSAAVFDEQLEELSQARGVIFDQRWNGKLEGKDNPTFKPFQLAEHVIPHLIGEDIQVSPMRIPRVELPDREGWEYFETTWPVVPAEPRFRGKVVFINEPSVVSYGETCMALVEGYDLGSMVGTATAGCNGNANFISLPGGFRVMWTGMEVLRHDRSSFYGEGFLPDVAVVKTRAAVLAGRDEYLEAAISLVEQGDAGGF